MNEKLDDTKTNGNIKNSIVSFKRIASAVLA
jgi:hypothetical protein